MQCTRKAVKALKAHKYYKVLNSDYNIIRDYYSHIDPLV